MALGPLPSNFGRIFRFQLLLLGGFQGFVFGAPAILKKAFSADCLSFYQIGIRRPIAPKISPKAREAKTGTRSQGRAECLTRLSRNAKRIHEENQCSLQIGPPDLRWTQHSHGKHWPSGLFWRRAERCRQSKKYRWRGSNPHSRRNAILSRARLPIPPHRLRGTAYVAVNSFQLKAKNVAIFRI